MIQDFLIPFLAIGIAELGDKTQLAVICLSAKTKRYLQLLLGIILAFIVADGLAIIVGGYLTNLVPVSYIKISAGLIFIIFGIITILSKEEEGKCDLKTPFASGFLLVLVSEMGDKTQLSSALFAAQYNPWLVFSGVIFALAILSVAGVYLGQFIIKKVPRKTIAYVAGGLFIVIGVLTTLQII